MFQKMEEKVLQFNTNIQTQFAEKNARVSSTNTYLGKNIQFSDGKICYVTQQGVAKPYKDTTTYNETAGKNGCPTQSIALNMPWSSEYIEGTILPTTPSLLIGSSMVSGQSCGYEGSSVRATSLIQQPTSTYIGCYNDIEGSETNAVPILTSANSSNGFSAKASSTYMGNNNYGAWAAFNQKGEDWWHSEPMYDQATGSYKGSASVNSVKGEWLQITFPNATTILQYSIRPRMDMATKRSPHSWYIFGFADNQWTQIDRQVDQDFSSSTKNNAKKTFPIANPGSYSIYALLVDSVGNSSETSGRESVQIAEWNLYVDEVSTGERSMTYDTIGYSTLEECQEYAINNGYLYFGLQDYQTDTGKAICSVSNDMAKAKIYGDATLKQTLIPIWSPNVPGTFARLTARGSLQIINENGDVLWQSTESGECKVDYSVSEGMNAKGSDLEHKTGTTLDQCKTACADNDKCYGFSMNAADGNECWLKSQFQNVTSTEGRSLYQRVQTNKSSCKFYLQVGDDGILSIFQGTPESHSSTPLWTSGSSSTSTSGSGISSSSNSNSSTGNPDWVASKGTFGRNYIISGEVLGVDQWIGSAKGKCKLVMQSNGQLVLFRSEMKQGCSKQKNNQLFGQSGVNALYQLPAVADRSSLGKMAFIDADSKRREYADSFLGFSDQYQVLQNTDSTGNDLSTQTTTSQTECQTACDANANCAAYVYQGSSQTCWLKDGNTYPKANKLTNNGMVMGLRKPVLKSSRCSQKITEIDAIHYDKYIKGEEITNEDGCKGNIMTPEQWDKYEQQSSNMKTMGSLLASETEAQAKSIKHPDTSVFWTKYEELKKINGNNMQKEGMQNIRDVNGMLIDSELKVLQENYIYVMWTIAAAAGVLVAVKLMK
jgi:hypothetical protein